MDPIAFVVATYINSVSANISNQVSEIYGVEIQSVATEYHGHNLTYSYQMWKIKPESVCGNQKSNINRYSACTQEAKNFFDEMCSHLQQKPSTHWKHSKNINMYCNAAISYKPVIASILKAGEPTESETARKTCNAAIAQHLGNNSLAAQHQINKACAAYRSLEE